MNSLIVLLLHFIFFNDSKVEIAINGPSSISNNFYYGDTLDISIRIPNHYKLDSVGFYLDGKRKTPGCTHSYRWNTQNEKLGIHTITFLIYSGGRDVMSLCREIELRSDIKPDTLNYRIVHCYPHDTLAFTQGLYFKDKTLYESTGLVGRSSLRKVDMATGKPLYHYNIPTPFFGEGLTIFRNSIYQLTWKNRLCFVYDLSAMTLQASMRQHTEGWVKATR